MLGEKALGQSSIKVQSLPAHARNSNKQLYRHKTNYNCSSVAVSRVIASV